MARNRSLSPPPAERGAAIIEFAVVLPVLLLIILGAIEFGWLMGQNNDVRHGAREAARLATVDAGSVSAMGATACDAMDLASGPTVTFTDSSTGRNGSQGTVRVQMPVASITNFPVITAMLPANLTSEVKFRLEQDSDSWATGSFTCP